MATSRFCQTNSVVVHGDAGVLLIDPGVFADELAALSGQLAGTRVLAGLSTHAHWDHLLWTPEFGATPRYASERAVAWLADGGLALARSEALAEDAAIDLDVFAQVRPVLTGRLDWPGPRVELIVHDAHAPGHLAVWLPEAGVLIAGDMCSDVEVPLLDLGAVDPMADYRRGMALLATIAGQCEVLIPGHGRVATGRDEIARRFEQDAAYLRGLASGRADQDARLPAAPQWLRAEHARQQAQIQRDASTAG